MTRLRVLHAIHDFLPRHLAGSELYAFELCRELGQRHSVHVLCAEYDPTRPHGSLSWRHHEGVAVTELVNNWRFRTFEETYASPLIGERLAAVLGAIQPDVLHVHNLLNLSFDLPRLAKARGIPTVATLHDFSLVCPSGGQRVHRAERHVCVDIDPARCARCFAESPSAPQLAFGHSGVRMWIAQEVARRAPWLVRVPELLRVVRAGSARATFASVGTDAIARRLERAREVFASIDLFVSPSRALAEDLVRFGLPADKVVVSDYGFAPRPPVPRVPRGPRLRLGFVGTLSWHKGVHTLVEAVRQLPADRVQLEIFGDPRCFPDYVAEVQARAAGAPIVFRGAFPPDRVAEVHAGLDVLVVPSLWPENSPLVIHEAFLAGVPVVAARTGGIPELVTHGESGLLYDGSVSGLAAALQSLVEQPALLAELGRRAPRVKTIEEDAAEWEARYLQLIARKDAA